MKLFASHAQQLPVHIKGSTEFQYKPIVVRSGDYLPSQNTQPSQPITQMVLTKLNIATDKNNAKTSTTKQYKKAQLSLTNPRDAKACQKLLQFDVLTTLSLTILAYLHSFNCYCIRNLRNPAKFTENSSLYSSRSSKVIDLGANGKPICDLLLVINSNFSRICYRFGDIHD